MLPDTRGTSSSRAPFWEFGSRRDGIALIDGRNCVSYSDLDVLVTELVHVFGDLAEHRTVGFLSFPPATCAIAVYLAALRSRRAVPLLLQPSMNDKLLAKLVEQYSPDWIFAGADGPPIEGYRSIWERDGMRLALRNADNRRSAPHPDLAILLSTSGSTGAQKLVRLSYSALAANAASIVDYLELSPAERAITTMPLAYSFGMSIINSHLAAGASVVLSDKSVVSGEFWNLAKESGVTSLSGVPSTFEMLRRAGIERRGLDRLTTLTQAGGAMRPQLALYFEGLAHQHGWRMIVMYGQTEAAPRISYVPPERLREKVGSIGIPVPGGELEVDPASRELIYRGPNVMMGYAESAEDLSRGDDCGGVLRTGDIGHADKEGFFYITGRIKRFVKLSGARIGLDALEQQLTELLETTVVCTGRDETLELWLCADAGRSDAEVRTCLRHTFDIYPGLAKIYRVQEIPLTANGKTDYRALAAANEERA